MTRIVLSMIPFLILLSVQCKSQKPVDAYNTEIQKIISISNYSFVHVPYLNTSEYGNYSATDLFV